ncbi:Haem-degrading [Natronincola peptidivorans]|uniref:Corrinoid adenosyltransferase n=1 Tax=Natronincola peptidivorans TaxID=426128 RepID=A0A1I0CFV8_9FIRM|nr:cob(I)yrinic acid a,c-diamide adenosyltransferase [Natronincola peptidivorans]SET18384.1 Haem-degrading [Natronincola peptidivorans]
MKIYTKSGDEGNTINLQGKFLTKDDDKIHLLGTLDELNSYIGWIISFEKNAPWLQSLKLIQNNLMLLMADLANDEKKEWQIQQKEITYLEKEIDKLQAQFPKQKKFVLPGKTVLSSMLDIARTVARRGERYLITVDKRDAVEPRVKQYMNRLSDYLYTIARYVDFQSIIEEAVVEVLQHHDGIGQKDIKLTLETAKKLMDKIEIKAKKMGLPVVVAVANSEGNMIGVHVMDHALPASYDIAVNKAYTAAAVRISTKELGKLCKPGEPLYGIQNTNQGKIVTFGGGCPIKAQNKVIGGLGVSGGSAEQDILLAEYGIEQVEEVLKWQWQTEKSRKL